MPISIADRNDRRTSLSTTTFADYDLVLEGLLPKIRSQAFAAASEYAPKPNGSAWTYGVIGAILLSVVLVFVAAFYGIDLARYPLFLAGGLAAAFACGVVLRRKHNRRHNEAFAAEYAKASLEGL